MTKKEFIDAVAKTSKAASSKKELGAILDTAFDLMKKTVKKGDKFIYPGFGIFSLRKRKARTGRNPRTGEAIKIKASKTVAFKPSVAFKSSL
jgi:DNA-binding protein HU-beta